MLVMRDEDKAAARERFATPLLFSIHEAKGLEYENIVLYRFVSNNRREFDDIAAGVERADNTYLQVIVRTGSRFSITRQSSAVGRH